MSLLDYRLEDAVDGLSRGSKERNDVAMNRRRGDRLRGKLHLQVCESGRRVAERRATNLVLRQGAEAVARLMAQLEGAEPINQMQVGVGRETGDASLTALTSPEGVALETLRSPVEVTDFELRTDGPAFIQLSVAAIFRPSQDLVGISEAGLLAGPVLYNQVVFEPVDLRADQDITFFWDLEIPFGR